MDQPLASLDSLGLRFNTDKSSRHHDYLSFYEGMFERMRFEKLRFLEIGVLYGASLKTWEAYFPNATVIGCDINPGITTFNTERIRTEIMDQSNLEDLVRVGMTHGPFDVILEDGSHLWEHQITTLRTLFPFVKNGGYYIVEDLQTNYGEFAESFRGHASISCVEYLKKLLDYRVGDDKLRIDTEEDPFLRTYGRNVQSMNFYRRACVIRKDYRTRSDLVAAGFMGDGDLVTAPLMTTEGDAAPVSITCHFGQLGDRRSETGSISAARQGCEIQGFVIYSDELAASGMLYRARRADGSWTEWVSSNVFAGTMGVGRSLTGLAVRVPDPGWVVRVAGLFGASMEPVVVGNGMDCVGAMAGMPLFGMQLEAVRL